MVSIGFVEPTPQSSTGRLHCSFENEQVDLVSDEFKERNFEINVDEFTQREILARAIYRQRGPVGIKIPNSMAPLTGATGPSQP